MRRKALGLDFQYNIAHARLFAESARIACESPNLSKDQSAGDGGQFSLRVPPGRWPRSQGKESPSRGVPETGCSGYFIKPIDVGTFAAEIARFLR